MSKKHSLLYGPYLLWTAAFILIPLLLILPKFMGINGVLAASPIADTLAFIMSVSMVLLSFRRLHELSPKEHAQ